MANLCSPLAEFSKVVIHIHDDSLDILWGERLN